MNLTGLFHGGGRRRRSDESWDDLTGRLSETERKLAHAERLLEPLKSTVCVFCQVHGRFWVQQPVPVPCPWCEIGRLRGRQLTEMVIAPALPAGQPLVPAPADLPGSVFTEPEPVTPGVEAPRIVADTPAGPAESEAADVNAETQAVAVSALWEAIGEDRTTLLPAVDDPSAAPHLEPAHAEVPPMPLYKPPGAPLDDPLPPIRWGTGLHGDVSPSAVPPGRMPLAVLARSAGGPPCS